MSVILYCPNVCSTLVRTPKQTFSAAQTPYRAQCAGLVPSDIIFIQLPLVGPSNSVFFSTHSSYRLDKINSDMRNYITNFAADLRWIQLSAFPPLTSLMLPCCSGQASEPAGSLPCWHTQYGRFTEQTLKTSQWGVIWSNLLLLENHKALLNTI